MSDATSDAAMENAMIIDARETSHPNFRPNSISGAIYAALENVEVGGHIDVHGVFDMTGRRLTKAQFRSALSGLKTQGHLAVRTAFLPEEKCFVIHKLEAPDNLMGLSGKIFDVKIDARSKWPNPHFRECSVAGCLWHLLEAHELGTAIRISVIIKSSGDLGKEHTIRTAIQQIREKGMDAYVTKARDGRLIVRKLS
jgi:hypothetical protein